MLYVILQTVRQTNHLNHNFLPVGGCNDSGAIRLTEQLPHTQRHLSFHSMTLSNHFLKVCHSSAQHTTGAHWLLHAPTTASVNQFLPLYLLNQNVLLSATHPMLSVYPQNTIKVTFVKASYLLMHCSHVALRLIWQVSQSMNDCRHLLCMDPIC